MYIQIDIDVCANIYIYRERQTERQGERQNYQWCYSFQLSDCCRSSFCFFSQQLLRYQSIARSSIYIRLHQVPQFNIRWKSRSKECSNFYAFLLQWLPVRELNLLTIGQYLYKCLHQLPFLLSFVCFVDFVLNAWIIPPALN